MLRNTSLVFESMLSIPPPIPPNAAEIAAPKHQNIPLTEPSHVLERCLTLMMCRPLPDEAFSTIEDIQASARFFDKYEVEGGMSMLSILVARSSQLLSDKSLEIYKLARSFGWSKIVANVTLLCIRDNPSTPTVIEALKDVDLVDYTFLVSLAQKRISSFESATLEMKDVFPEIDQYPDYKRAMKDPIKLRTWTSFRNRAVLTMHHHPGKTAKVLFPIDDWSETTALKKLFNEIAPDNKYSVKGLKGKLDEMVKALPKS